MARYCSMELTYAGSATREGGGKTSGAAMARGKLCEKGTFVPMAAVALRVLRTAPLGVRAAAALVRFNSNGGNAWVDPKAMPKVRRPCMQCADCAVSGCAQSFMRRLVALCIA